jgi:hypothetical protein
MNNLAFNEEPSIGELFGDLASETSTLLRQELRLLVVELKQKAKYAARQGIYVAVGAIIALIAVVTLVGALVLGLGMVMPLWASALLVGGITLAVAGAVIAKGIVALRHLDPIPTQTALSIEDNKSWIRKQIQ